jgi:hypothetical protein
MPSAEEFRKWYEKWAGKSTLKPMEMIREPMIS